MSTSIGDVINDDELALRKAEESASRRFQASEWLRTMDQSASESLRDNPSEEEFCLALRNGLILCNVLNKINPGAIFKIVESPVISIQSTDAAAQSAIQYFENMRNFLDAVSEMKLLTFEASDLEKGGSSSKVVECILCLKGYYEWKLAGGVGVWRFGGTVRIVSSRKGGGSALRCEQQLEEVVEVMSEGLVEEVKGMGAASALFDKFGLGLLERVLEEFNGVVVDELIINPRLVDMVLDQALKQLYVLLESQRNQLGSLLKKKMKDEDGSTLKVELLEDILRHLKEKSCDSCSCLKFCVCGCNQNVNKEERLELQQRQLEKLKLSFHEMKSQVECNRRKWQEDLEKFEKHMEGLKVNASSYYKLLEENRMLYNQVQDLKGNIRVYCRVKPFLTNESSDESTVDHIGENGNIMIINPQKRGKDARKIFSFNKVFGANITQREVFVDTQPLIRSVMDGYNVCIFAYGQTGSGKTYTMSGPDITSEETWGVNYRALNDLFQISKSRIDISTYDVSVQMIEIYNEQVRDLLVSDGSNKRLEIRNNTQLNGLNIPDASLISVKCTQDVLNLMKIGQRNRAVGATALNERSSRSHSVLTVHVQGTELVSGSVLRGCLHLVDLAGSERVDKSEATGERLKEAQHINRSLSALGDVISALAQKGSHIPYRNSKLTQVLQDALGGHAKTLMFVHISPEINSYGETISTLKFAERVASIELGTAHANKETSEVRDLKEEISKLKSALEVKESEVTQSKANAYRISMEMKNLTTASPLQSHKQVGSMNMKLEGIQQPAYVNARQIESRSCSSGKQRKPCFPSVSSDKEHDSKSPFSVGDNIVKSRKRRSPSPVRRSLSSDRAVVIKAKSRIHTIGERPVLKLHFPEKASPVSESITSIPRISTRKVFTEQEEDQTVKPAPTIRKFKTDSKKFDIDNGGRSEERKKRDLSETENDCRQSIRDKRFQHYVPRISQNIELRNFHQTVEQSQVKPENKPPNSVIRNVKEGGKTPETEIRRSISLPRGKFI